MPTTPLHRASALSPSPPTHTHNCDSESELPDPLHPLPKRARCGSADHNALQTLSSGDIDPAPQIQLEETRAESSPRPRSSSHDDVLDAQNIEVDEDEDQDDIVLSEVHIHPENGRVDGRWLTSVFLLSHTNQDQHQETNSDNGSIEDEDQVPHTWDHALEIQHAMGTTLREVGTLEL